MEGVCLNHPIVCKPYLYYVRNRTSSKLRASGRAMSLLLYSSSTFYILNGPLFRMNFQKIAPFYNRYLVPIQIYGIQEQNRTYATDHIASTLNARQIIINHHLKPHPPLFLRINKSHQPQHHTLSSAAYKPHNPPHFPHY